MDAQPEGDRRPAAGASFPVPDPVVLPPGTAPAPPPVAALPRPTVDLPPYGAAPLATLTERFVGAVIDAVVMVIPAQLLTLLLPEVLDIAAGPAVSALYLIPMLARFGATLGGRAVGIRCVAATGGLPGFWRSARRWLPMYLPAAIPVVGPLALLLVGVSPLFDGRMQGLHDKFAGTYVVKTGTGSPVPPAF